MARSQKNDLEEAVSRFNDASDSLEKVAVAARALEASAEKEKKSIGALAEATGKVAEAAAGLGEVSDALRDTTKTVAAVTASAKTVIDASDVQQVEKKLDEVLKSTGEVASRVGAQINDLGSKMFEELARFTKEQTTKHETLSQELLAVQKRLDNQQGQLERILASMPDRWRRRSAE